MHGNQHSIPNISFCVLQQKESQTGMNQHEGEKNDDNMNYLIVGAIEWNEKQYHGFSKAW